MQVGHFIRAMGLGLALSIVSASLAQAKMVVVQSSQYPGTCALFSGKVAPGLTLRGSTGCPCDSTPNSPLCKLRGRSITIDSVNGGTVTFVDQDQDRGTGQIQ